MCLNSLFQFEYTQRDRTYDSYQAFLEGLFQHNAFTVRANIENENDLYSMVR